MIRALLLLLGGGGVAAIAAAAWLWSALHAPVPADTERVLEFTVETGEPLSSVARRLDAEGLLPDLAGLGPRAWVAWAHWRGVDREVKSGEYALEPGLSPAQILDALVDGRVRTWPVTLPEGLRLDEIAARLEAAGIVAADAFLAGARDPELIRDLGLGASSFEGYLYPETYRFRKRSSAREVIERMYAEHLARWTDADREALRAAGRDTHEVVTLASIVEKETSVPDERPLVAAVFHNRLERGMRLQTDPTVIYGILVTRGEFDGNIRRADLTTDTPYNTYTRAGLPPGPIASASIDSIRAVLDPPDVPYLYFVSRNDGTHEFTRTLSEHNTAVRRYQLGGG